MLDDIVNIATTDDQHEILGVALRGHLAVEALIVELLLLGRPDVNPWRKSFPDKTRLLEAAGVIEGSLKTALDQFNDFRNDCSHIFDHNVDMPSVLTLGRNLEAAGIDFSDSFPGLDAETVREWYGGERGALGAIVANILHDLAYRLFEAGGRDLFSIQSDH